MSEHGFGGHPFRQVSLKDKGFLASADPAPHQSPNRATDRDEPPPISDEEREAASRRLQHTSDAISRVFNRSRSSWGTRDSAYASPPFFFAFLGGRVPVRMTHLPLAICQQAMTMKVVRWGNETEDHARLKMAALLWMRAEGAQDAALEVKGINGIADAYSRDANWIMECGNTPFRKVAEAALWESVPRFTLIPFQHLERHDGSPRRLIAIDFSWSKEVTAELEAAHWAAMGRCADALELDDLSPLPTMEAGR